MACGSTYFWRGLTSWFCCGGAWGPCGSTNRGACGTCQSDVHMAAWPNLTAGCWSITNPAACGEHMPRAGCGYVVKVNHQCTSSNVCVSFADCGPNTQQFCSARLCCNGECRTHRVTDLTASAFSAIGSLSAGVIPVWIYT